jgi:predicted esterase
MIGVMMAATDLHVPSIAGWRRRSSVVGANHYSKMGRMVRLTARHTGRPTRRGRERSGRRGPGRPEPDAQWARLSLGMRCTRAVVFVISLIVFTPGVASAQRSDAWQAHVEHALTLDHPLAAQAARFLADHAPPRDAELDHALLDENLELALRARDEFPWAAAIPEAIFLNDVLPHASLDETRERWRPALYAIAKQIVAEATTSGEAAQLLNQSLFDVVGVHYNTRRERANQSPFESMRQGRASCTGLSILLVNACRSVGVPARIAGVAEWTSTPGNHTWVEIWDGERWRYTGADEFNAKGLDRAWFTGRAAQAIAGSEAHAVWATSWRATGTHFPMAWNRSDRSVPGVDVTARYAPQHKPEAADATSVTRFVRVWNRREGERVVATLVFHDDDGTRRAPIRTRAGRADLNDMPTISLPRDARVLVDIRAGDTAVRTAVSISEAPTGVIDLYLDELARSEADARRLSDVIVAARRNELVTTCKEEVDNKSITIDEHTLAYLEHDFGPNDDTPRPLWISLHGGGGAPDEVNDRQWRNQARLYQPKEGVYIAPRAPTDTWNLWHRAHIDPLLDRLIANMIVARNVDPNRVYLLGYSAGGDGVYQLAPRMADRFAAASMMAGHPNEARPLGLRNLPFAIFMGAEDGAYDRNAVARRWADQLAELRAEDPAGYEHRVEIYPGLGHWMEGRDAEALPWMLEYVRDPWPDRVVWRQDDVVGARFYWLGVRPEEASAGQMIAAEIRGQTVAIETDPERSPEHLTLRLSDALVDLDRPVSVTVNGENVFDGRVMRSRGAIESSVEERFDPAAIATAVVEIKLR